MRILHHKTDMDDEQPIQQDTRLAIIVITISEQEDGVLTGKVQMTGDRELSPASQFIVQQFSASLGPSLGMAINVLTDMARQQQATNPQD